MSAVLGHLAVYAACYVTAQVMLATMLAGASLTWRVVLVAALVALGTYLVDRSGPWPGPADRGDLRAHPDRVRFLRRHALLVRLLAIASLGGAFLAALPWGPVAAVVPVSVLGLLCYGRWALPGRRLKDRLWIKNGTVALSITLLALVLVSFTDAGHPEPLGLGVAGAVLLLRVGADAMRCDIDDARSDARQGTRTVANVLGVETAWRIALVLDVAAAGAALASAPLLGWGAALALAIVPLVPGVLLTLRRPPAVRDLVDAGGALGVLLAWALVLTLPSASG